MNHDVITRILDLARWAPSGDNTQPWRFEVLGDHQLIVHGFDTREHCVYDLDGHPSQISLGALLETIDIGATAEGWRTSCQRMPGSSDTQPAFQILFEEDPAVKPSPLLPYIPLRTVQRRPLHTRPLTPGEKQVLEASVGTSHAIVWLENLRTRWRVARLLFRNAKLRLTLPEAYAVHHSIIQWDARFSEDRIPDQALGLDPLTVRLMRWVMADWKRVKFFNTYLAGTLAPRLQLDLLPGLLCGAHFAILTKHPLETLEDYVAAGRATQQFWLTATSVGLQLQPEMTPVIFSRYVREGRVFSDTPGMAGQAEHIAEQFTDLMGAEIVPKIAFFGRIGEGAPAQARSTRLPISKLWHPGQNT